MSEQKPTVEAGRRRPTGDSAPTGRAEAPSRRRSSAGSSGGLPPASAGTGPSLPGLPGGMPRKLSLGCVVLLVILFVAIRLFSGGSDTGTLAPESDVSQVEEPLPTVEVPEQEISTPRPTRTPGMVSSGDTWLVMVYQDADDKVLEKDIYIDLNEIERVGSSANVQIVAQIDRFRGGYEGDGDWVTARRYYVTQDDNLQRVRSETVMDLGEVNMADGETLVDFVTWAMENYPADKYALILSDHGMGWPGGWSDPTSRSSTGDLPLARVVGDQLFLNEIDQALEEIRSQTGMDKFEMIGMDACLMGQLEVFTALAPHARYAVMSQETEPSLGWAYASFLGELTDSPAMNGADLGEAVVKSYILGDQRIVDDQARADFVGPGNLVNSLFGAAGVPDASQVSGQMIRDITLAAVDLKALPAVMESFNDLAYALQEADAQDVAQARSYAQSFTSIFGKDVPPSYIDLGHFAQLAGRTSGLRSIGEVSNRLQEAIAAAVIAERHGKNKPGATGISIYFPNSALFRTAEAGPQSYTVAAERFARASLWDEFLAFHYTGRAFERGEQAVTLPERGTTIEAPAAGGVDVSPIQASARTVEPGGSIRLTSELSGANIGYVRLLVGYLDEANNSLYMIDSDYLESPETKELNGVYYPDWGAEAFTLAFNWEPIVFAIDDGNTTAVALLTPENYGATAEDAVYSVEGLYTFADGSEQRHARLYFSNGKMYQVFGFTGEEGTGAPREITPAAGDTFTILEEWSDLDAQGNVVEVVRQEGETLTFGQELFTWQQLYAAPGKYVVGFVVEDLDGNSQTVFVPVTVR